MPLPWWTNWAALGFQLGTIAWQLRVARRQRLKADRDFKVILADAETYRDEWRERVRAFKESGEL